MLLSDPDTLLEGSFTVEVMLMFLSQLLGYVNLLCLALPPKMEKTFLLKQSRTNYVCLYNSTFPLRRLI